MTIDESSNVSERIDKVFENIAMAETQGLQENFQNKIIEYATRIQNGESREKVLEGLPDSFTSAISIHLLRDRIKEYYPSSSEKNETSLEGLIDMDQLEFAKWLQENRNSLEKITTQATSMSGKPITIHPFGSSSLSYYDLLTLRPEYRAQAISSISNCIISPEYQESSEYLRSIRSQEERYTNSDSNPDWFSLNFGDTRNKEKDGMRRKGYLTLDPVSIDSFKENIPTIIHDINESLTGRYNGAFKITQKLSTLLNQFDNMVVHGADEREVDIALKIITEVLDRNNIKSKISQKGKDGFDKKGKKTSHTKLLEEQILRREL